MLVHVAFQDDIDAILIYATKVLSAAHYPPVATSSTLAYVLCRSLHPDIRGQTDYLCAIGTMGDLGSNMKWAHPWPAGDMKECNKTYGKKTLSDAVRLVNARMPHISSGSYALS